jgi:hypothetical protein
MLETLVYISPVNTVANLQEGVEEFCGDFERVQQLIVRCAKCYMKHPLWASRESNKIMAFHY